MSYGEADDADEEAIAREIPLIQSKLLHYSLSDIFNAI